MVRTANAQRVPPLRPSASRPENVSGWFYLVVVYVVLCLGVYLFLYHAFMPPQGVVAAEPHSYVEARSASAPAGWDPMPLWYRDIEHYGGRK